MAALEASLAASKGGKVRLTEVGADSNGAKKPATSKRKPAAKKPAAKRTEKKPRAKTKA
jgi:hypothetical protein